jgi:hypothetical protein
MKTDQKHIAEICQQFAKMQTTEDFVTLLNVAKALFYGDQQKPFSHKSVHYFANYKLGNKRYKTFFIRKKNGGQRTINAPKPGLKRIQRILNFVLQCVAEPHKAATGFVPGKSIVDNATLHVGKNYVYNIDLKDFFHSIELHRVKACLKLSPFNLNNNREPLAFLIANLCCTELEVERTSEGNTTIEKRSVTPQGAPTSPTITNIVAKSMDKKLAKLAKKFNLEYSRYADDITFSSDHHVYQANSSFVRKLNQIIEDQHFVLNQAKVRLQKSVHKQEVTGITVNQKTNVSRNYVKQLRMWLYYWETYGYNKAEQLFRNDYQRDKGHVKKSKATLVNVLYGKLLYLKMVKGETDATFSALNTRFEVLAQGRSFIDTVLETWEKEGIEKAMELYYKNIE